jgi:hypothetical protein
MVGSDSASNKSFDLESHVYEIMSIANKDLASAKAHWLSGLDKINNNSRLDYSRTCSYVGNVLACHPGFFGLVSNDFLSSYKKEYASGKLIPLHLPVNDETHLALWLNRNKDILTLFYMNIEHNNNVLILPYAFLKDSLDFSNDPKSIKLLEKGKLDLDDDWIICQDNFQDVMDSYTAFDNFVRAARKR